MVTRGVGMGGWVEKVKGNIVNNIVVSLYGDYKIMTRISGVTTLYGIKMLNYYIVHLKII